MMVNQNLFIVVNGLESYRDSFEQSFPLQRHTDDSNIVKLAIKLPVPERYKEPVRKPIIALDDENVQNSLQMEK